ncbi:Hypothetical protein FKW44_002575, partial [Caligus rogercresseyi]
MASIILSFGHEGFVNLDNPQFLGLQFFVGTNSIYVSEHMPRKLSTSSRLADLGLTSKTFVAIEMGILWAQHQTNL